MSAPTITANAPNSLVLLIPPACQDSASVSGSDRVLSIFIANNSPFTLTLVASDLSPGIWLEAPPELIPAWSLCGIRCCSVGQLLRVGGRCAYEVAALPGDQVRLRLFVHSAPHRIRTLLERGLNIPVQGCTLGMPFFVCCGVSWTRPMQDSLPVQQALSRCVVQHEHVIEGALGEVLFSSRIHHLVSSVDFPNYLCNVCTHGWLDVVLPLLLAAIVHDFVLGIDSMVRAVRGKCYTHGRRCRRSKLSVPHAVRGEKRTWPARIFTGPFSMCSRPFLQRASFHAPQPNLFVHSPPRPTYVLQVT